VDEHAHNTTTSVSSVAFVEGAPRIWTLSKWLSELVAEPDRLFRMKA